MKLKKYMLYILYVVLIYILVLFINWSNTLSKNYININYKINILYSIIPIFASMILGLLMSTEYLFKQFKKNGTWKININKLTFIVTPLLLLSFSLNIYYLNIFPKLSKILINLNSSIPSYLIFSILCGYSFATSFYKIKEANC